MRELNRLGVTGVIDAGGGFQNYPDDYEVIEELHERGELTVRIAYNLFTQKPKQELDGLHAAGSQMTKPGEGDDFYRLNGAGEMLVFSAADFEDFLEPRPDMPPAMEGELEAVVRILAENRWPFRLHATYDETIPRFLDVFEEVNRDDPVRRPALVLRPRRDDLRPQHRAHQSARRRHRRPAPHGLPGRVLRRALRREGRRAHAADPPHAGDGRSRRRRHRRHARRQLQPVGVAVLARHRQDGRRTRALSGGQPPRPRGGAAALHRRAAAGSPAEDGKKGSIALGQLADLAVLSADYFSVPEEEIKQHRIGADDRRRQGGVRRRRIRQTRAAAAARESRLVAGENT